jgi:amino-acid N-acetyltransferase
MNFTKHLPPDCHIRPARAEDIWTIRQLVFRAMLDPTQLRWQQFWLIECDGQVLACGQLRAFADCQELGSLVVRPAWRRQGLGTVLTQHLIQQANSPLYLECLGKQRAQFYRQLGFETVENETFPPALRRKFGVSQAIAQLFQLPLYQMRFSTSAAET